MLHPTGDVNRASPNWSPDVIETLSAPESCNVAPMPFVIVSEASTVPLVKSLNPTTAFVPQPRGILDMSIVRRSGV